MKRRYVWIGVAVVVVAAIGFFAYTRVQAGQAAAQSAYETEPIRKGDLTATVGATGTVRANQTATLYWGTTGTVGKVNVKLDQSVKKDEILAEIDPETLPQNVILAQADLVTAQRNLDDLRASTSAQSQAQVNLAQAQQELDDAKQTRLNLTYRFNQDQVLAAEANYLMAENEVDRLQEIYDRASRRKEKDPVRLLALANLENGKKRRDKALISLNWYKGKADPKDIAKADAKVALAQSKLEDAQREWNRLKGGTDPQDVLAAEAKVRAIQATLDMAHLKAPFAGSVTAVEAKEGDKVNAVTSSAAMQYAFRVDDLSHLLVDVPVSEVDINRIQVGQPATLTFDAIQNKTYHGAVTEVARVGVTDQGAVNFTVTVELTDADAAVRPGMTAAVNIVSTQLKNVLQVPNLAMRVRDGKRYIFLFKNGVAEATEITLGATAENYSQVISDNVHEGDLLVLNPPSLPTTMGGRPSFAGGAQ